LARENFGASLVAEAGPAEEPQTDIGNEIDDAPVVLYIQKILLDAINALASDVNFEPYEKFYRVRDWTDDIQYEFAQPPLALTEKTASRIKAISRPDISEKRVPRDGRMNLAPSKNRATDFRLGTLPTPHGEKIVMRILDTSSTTLAIETLGCGQDQKEELLRTWIKEDELDENWAPHKAVGCDAFKSIDYKARVGIHEVMRISEEMNQVIMTNGNAIDVAEQAQREGIRDLRQSGLLKVKQSVTSLEEIEADTNE
jgi:type II secretory ATPase GspE/PulE/Tfp pilus assembly ATPase PilB-like protein